MADGEVDAAPHREADQDGGDEDHERVGAPDSGERGFAEESSDDQCIDDIVELSGKLKVKCRPIDPDGYSFVRAFSKHDND